MTTDTERDDTTTPRDRRFDGAVVVVTGGASGIGAATARRVASEGASVGVLDLDREGAEALASELASAVGLGMDVRASESVDRAFARVVEEFGRIDGLVHAAGRGMPTAVKRHVAEQIRSRAAGERDGGIEGIVALSDEDWRCVLSVNLDGTFYCVRAALRQMIPRRRGSIVTISSMSALSGDAGFSAYSASKGGVRVFTQALAREVIGYGIRANSIAPGATDTPMARSTTEAGFDEFVSRLPTGRMADPEEIAAAIAFLLSDDASYVVGETLNVNGGIVIV